MEIFGGNDQIRIIRVMKMQSVMLILAMLLTASYATDVFIEIARPPPYYWDQFG